MVISKFQFRQAKTDLSHRAIQRIISDHDQISGLSNKITFSEEIPSDSIKSLTAILRDSTFVFIEYTKSIESSINGQYNWL
ncbi:unnamed protein product [Rotaria sp. Silwood2]|nr:unnamed protein product [Rotaria sp. Silwood2]CAF4450484.1 unnamed protein product [Rotaria sp. Silwood2]